MINCGELLWYICYNLSHHVWHEEKVRSYDARLRRSLLDNLGKDEFSQIICADLVCDGESAKRFYSRLLGTVQSFCRKHGYNLVVYRNDVYTDDSGNIMSNKYSNMLQLVFEKVK